MENSINTSPESNASKTLEAFIQEYSELIFDEKIWKTKELWKISEVTFSYVYEKNNTVDKLNTTLFVSWGWLNLQKYYESDDKTRKSLLLTSRKNLENILKEKKELIKEALSEIKTVDSLNNWEVETDIREIFLIFL